MLTASLSCRISSLPPADTTARRIRVSEGGGAGWWEMRWVLGGRGSFSSMTLVVHGNQRRAGGFGLILRMVDFIHTAAWIRARIRATIWTGLSTWLLVKLSWEMLDETIICHIILPGENNCTSRCSKTSISASKFPGIGTVLVHTYWYLGLRWLFCLSAAGTAYLLNDKISMASLFHIWNCMYDWFVRLINRTYDWLILSHLVGLITSFPHRLATTNSLAHRYHIWIIVT